MEKNSRESLLRDKQYNTAINSDTVAINVDDTVNEKLNKENYKVLSLEEDLWMLVMFTGLKERLKNVSNSIE